MSATRDPAILRAEALALLEEAASIDGLQPFVITHSTRSGESAYVGWARRMPSEDEAASILEHEFEPDRNESLTVNDNILLSELVGASPSSIIEQAPVSQLGPDPHM